MTKQKIARKPRLKKKHQDLIFYILILAIPMVQFIIFYLGVNVNSVLLSFKSYDHNTGLYEFSGLVNFKQVFSDFGRLPLLGKSIANSLIAYLIGLIFGTGFTILFSYYIYKKRFMGNFYKVVLFLPSIVSSVVMVMMFKYTTERALPPLINSIFGTEFIGFLSEKSTGFATLLFFGIWAGFGGGVLLYLGAMNQIDGSIIEAAQIDGATLFQEFRHITLPLIFPTFSTLFLVGLAGIATNQINLYLFYGHSVPENYYTLGWYMFRDLVTGDAGLSQYPYLSAMGIVLTIFMIPLVFSIRRVLMKYGPTTE